MADIKDQIQEFLAKQTAGNTATRTAPRGTADTAAFTQMESLLAGRKASQVNNPQNQPLAMVTSPDGNILDDTFEAPQRSPLNIMQRLALSFADDAGRERVLREQFKFVERLPDGKFAVGNDPRNLQPIDPVGVFNDVMGDLADVAAIIPIIAGQVGGALAGFAAGGFPGAVAGGGLGASAGSAVSKIIGKGIRVSDQTIEEQATDVAIDGAFGLIGEGVGLTLAVAARAGTRVLAPRIGKLLDPLVKGPRQLGERAKALIPETFNITAGVPANATRIVLRNGPTEALSPKNMRPETVLELLDTVPQVIIGQRKALGRAVGEAGEELIELSKGREVVNMTNSFRTLTKDLRGTGFLGEGNVINPAFASKGSDISTFTKLLTQISNNRGFRTPKIGRFGQPLGKQTFKAFTAPKEGLFTTVDDLAIIQRQFANTFDDLSPDGQFIMRRFLRGETDELGNKSLQGIGDLLDGVAIRLGANNYRAANAAFAEFSNVADDLAKAGFDMKNKVNLEGFIRNIPESGEQVKRLLRIMDSKTPARRIVPEMENWAAAQEFRSANPNLLRLGAVASLLGATQAQTREGKIGFTGLALLVGSPRGARVLLRSGSGSSQVLNRIATGGVATAGQTRKATEAAGRAALGQILRQRAVPRQ